MEINQIKIGERHRKDMGDLAALAENIKTEGLLQPIGVTPQDDLVFGYRRLVACRDILGWKEIDERIVNVTSIVAGEYAENEMRKDFTVSERVAILETIKRYKQGENRFTKNRRQDPAVYNKDGAAQLAGLGNRTTAHEASMIVHSGCAELIAAVDAGEISIFAGSVIAKQPTEQRDTIIKLPKPERAAAVRQLHTAGKGKSKPGKSEAPPPPQSRRGKSRDFAGPRPTLRILSRDEAGEPSLEEWNQRAPGHPPGVTKGRLHVEKHGKVQLWSPADRALLELEGRARNFTACLRAILDPDGLEVPEIAGLTFKHGGEFRRSLRELLPRVEARLAAFAAAFLDEQTHEAMDKRSGGIVTTRRGPSNG